MGTILFNVTDNDSKFINKNTTNFVFDNLKNKNLDIFIDENINTIEIDDTYNYRPDKLAYELYGDDFYYPVLLVSNNIGSIIDFRIQKIGNKIQYLKPEKIPSLKL